MEIDKIIKERNFIMLKLCNDDEKLLKMLDKYIKLTLKLKNRK